MRADVPVRRAPLKNNLDFDPVCRRHCRSCALARIYGPWTFPDLGNDLIASSPIRRTALSRLTRLPDALLPLNQRCHVNQSCFSQLGAGPPGAGPRNGVRCCQIEWLQFPRWSRSVPGGPCYGWSSSKAPPWGEGRPECQPSWPICPRRWTGRALRAFWLEPAQATPICLWSRPLIAVFAVGSTPILPAWLVSALRP